MAKLWNLFLSEESGQGMVEYGLIVALVSVVLIVTLQALTGSLDDIFTAIKNALDDATP